MRYLALFTGDPAAADVLASEVRGNGYERQPFVASGEPISFPRASGPWGTITGCALVEDGRVLVAVPASRQTPIATDNLLEFTIWIKGEITPLGPAA